MTSGKNTLTLVTFFSSIQERWKRMLVPVKYLLELRIHENDLCDDMHPEYIEMK